MFEDEMIAAVDLRNDRKSIEALDARVESTAVHQMQDNWKTIAAGKVQKDVLDIGLSR